MELGDREMILFGYTPDLIEMLMPYPEARSHSSDIGPIAMTTSHTRIDSYRGISPREELSIGLELVETGRIELDTEFYDFLEIPRHFLACELYMRCWYSGVHSTIDLVFTRSIDMESLAREDLDDISI
jgi:hypothetical protein